MNVQYRLPRVGWYSVRTRCAPPCPTLSHPVPPFQPGLLCTIAVLRLVTKVVKIEGVRTRNPSPNKRAPPCPTLPALGNSDRRPTGPLVFFGRSQFWPPKGWDRVGHFCTVAYTETSIKTESDHTQQTTCPTLPRPCPRLTANAPVSLGHILGAHSSLSVSGEGFSRSHQLDTATDGWVRRRVRPPSHAEGGGGEMLYTSLQFTTHALFLLRQQTVILVHTCR